MTSEVNAKAGAHSDNLEKGVSQNGDNNGVSTDALLKQTRTANSVSISAELFEKIYLSPQNAVRGDLRKTFGNPTPVSVSRVYDADFL